MVLYDECLFGDQNNRITIYKSNDEDTVIITDMLRGITNKPLAIKRFKEEYSMMFEPEVLNIIIGGSQYE